MTKELKELKDMLKEKQIYKYITEVEAEFEDRGD